MGNNVMEKIHHIKELDFVRLKDGRTGTVMIYHEGEDQFTFEPDTAQCAEDLEDLDIGLIEEVISRA